jgi:hypothetical protein
VHALLQWHIPPFSTHANVENSRLQTGNAPLDFGPYDGINARSFPGGKTAPFPDQVGKAAQPSKLICFLKEVNVHVHL